MTPERRLEIEQAANLYGSTNGWAGTSGTLATMIRELLAEVDKKNVLIAIASAAFADINKDLRGMSEMIAKPIETYEVKNERA